MKDIENDLKAYYESQQFPTELPAQIRERGLAARKKQQQRNKIWLAGAAIAACCVVVLLLISGNSGSAPGQAMADHAAAGHRNHEPGAYQFETVGFDALQAKLDKVDFPLAEAEEMVRSRFDLSGCSYCGLLANFALHFNARERNTGREGSFYITALTGSFSKVSAGRYMSGDISVDIWTDSERLYLFAAPM